MVFDWSGHLHQRIAYTIVSQPLYDHNPTHSPDSESQAVA